MGNINATTKANTPTVSNCHMFGKRIFRLDTSTPEFLIPLVSDYRTRADRKGQLRLRRMLGSAKNSLRGFLEDYYATKR